MDVSIAQIAGIGIAAAALAVIVRQERPEFGTLIGVCGSVMIFFMVLPQLMTAVRVFNELAENIPAEAGYTGIILRIVGVAYIAEFGQQVCADAGEGAIAAKIELAGKVLVMVMSAPIVLGLVRMIGGVLG